MIYSISNNQLTVTVKSSGAELISVKSNKNDFEFMWQRDPMYWARTSPVLFPIVGKSKGNQLLYQGKSYLMSQHGFARDQDFMVTQINSTTLHGKLSSSEQTASIYPFSFELGITYQLIENELFNTWSIKNMGSDMMYFSIGAHPAFRLIEGKMEDYYLEFSHPENPVRYLLQDGLFDGRKSNIPFQDTLLNLKPELFLEDAIVMENIISNEVTLKHHTNAHQVKMRWGNIPYLGIWSPKECNQFVCIEPWYGLSDPILGHSDLSTKKGMIQLEPFNSWEKSYSISFVS